MLTTKDNNRIVILGAAGFLGFNLAKYFHQNSSLEIILVDNFLNGKKDLDFLQLINSTRIKFLELDLSCHNSYENLFLSTDIVLNCAAFNGTQNFYNRPADVIRNSALSSILAAQYCAVANVISYVYFGSSESYAGGVSIGITKVPTAENVPLVLEDVRNPRWSYAASKSMGEVATIANHLQNNLQYYILRIHNIYGPRMGTHHVIPDLIKKFSMGNFQVHGVNETRAFFYVEDLNNILSQIIFSHKVRINSTYNVGSTHEIRIADLAELLLKEMNIHAKIQPIDPFLGSVRRRCPDTSLLKSQISYTETPLVEGINKTLTWYKKNI
jgi:nucleoside-diphosphate-sugar epimerase